MAWTFPVALFFWTIASLLVLFTILAIRFPETPRHGILRIETTRGDRLFITLLGSAFICLVWLLFAGPPLWWALALCLVYAAAVSGAGSDGPMIPPEGSGDCPGKIQVTSRIPRRKT